MPAKILFFFTLLLIGGFLPAQTLTNRATLELTTFNETPSLLSQIYAIPLPEISPFLSFFIVWEGANDTFEVRFSENGVQWSNWEQLKRDFHNPEKKITEFFITQPNYHYFQIRKPKGAEGKATAHFFSPGNTPAIAPIAKNNPLEEQGDCDTPSIVDRRDWCPNGNCPSRSGPQFTEVSHLIVHHSAGTNNANDWAAIVRAIYDLHVVGNGWADIGYNYLVDPNGIIYEGRGEDVLGAHFCARNSKTMGVCVIGNFQNQQPTEAAITSLAEVLAWKALKEDIDPIGRSLHPSSGLNLSHISGHRQGCATACPGDQFFPLLNEVRQRVRDSVAVCTSLTAVNQPGIEESLQLFPNPVNDYLQVQWSTKQTGTVTIEIFSADGKKQQVFAPDNYAEHRSARLDVSDLAQGYYFLRISMNKHAVVRNFIKK